MPAKEGSTAIGVKEVAAKYPFRGSIRHVLPG